MWLRRKDWLVTAARDLGINWPRGKVWEKIETVRNKDRSRPWTPVFY